MFTKQGDTYVNGEFTIYCSKQIGKGAYGIVFECTKTNLPDQLCAKVIKSISTNADYLSRETDIINTLRQAYPNNPNLVKVYFCSYQKLDNADVLIVIMEKCSSNLKDELANKKKYTSDEVLNIFKQLLNGYKPLYEKSILHRDIKPENILISKDTQGKPIYKLADFGIGKVCAANDTVMTKVGTPVYAAPELNSFVNDDNLDKLVYQLKEIKNGKSQVDVFSIGIMLYQFLFGQPPFETKFPEQLGAFMRNLKSIPFKIQNPPRDINSDLLEMIEKMIVYNPLERIKFQEIYLHKLINIQTQQPAKFEQFIKQKENKNNRFTVNNTNIGSSVQPQVQSFQPIPNIQSNQINQMNQINQNNQNNQAQFRQTVNSNSNPNSNPTPNNTRFNSFNPAVQAQIPFQQQKFPQTPQQPVPSTTLQPGAPILNSVLQQQLTILGKNQFQSNNQIQIDEINDIQNYLKTQLSENQFFYSKQTEDLLKQAIQSFAGSDPKSILKFSKKLIQYYKFEETRCYSLGYLKFYYCLFTQAKNIAQRRQYNNEQDLLQEIKNITGR